MQAMSMTRLDLSVVGGEELVVEEAVEEMADEDFKLEVVYDRE